jgi:hypothetical protein
MSNQTKVETTTIAIEHIYCCEKSKYSKYVILTSDLHEEILNFINDYNDSYFLEDYPGTLGTDLPINKDEYDLIEIQHSHVHC